MAVRPVLARALAHSGASDAFQHCRASDSPTRAARLPFALALDRDGERAPISHGALPQRSSRRHFTLRFYPLPTAQPILQLAHPVGLLARIEFRPQLRGMPARHTSGDLSAMGQQIQQAHSCVEIRQAKVRNMLCGPLALCTCGLRKTFLPVSSIHQYQASPNANEHAPPMSPWIRASA
jgi:hypothetical protein